MVDSKIFYSLPDLNEFITNFNIKQENILSVTRKYSSAIGANTYELFYWRLHD